MQKGLRRALARLGIDGTTVTRLDDTTVTVYVLGAVVVKVFPADALDAFVRELDGLARGAEAGLPVPRVLAQGRLKSDTRFLVSSRLPGRPLLSLPSIEHQTALDMAVFLGRAMRALHDSRRVVLPSESDRHAAEWCRLMGRRLAGLSSQQWLCRRMHCASARAELQSDSGFWPNNWMSLYAWGDRPVYLHGDLNNENILIDERYANSAFGVLDFSDSLFGHRLYDFVAIHMSVFACDKRLLALFLQVYGVQGLPATASAFAYACFVYCLLCDSPAFRAAAEVVPQLRDCASLSQMATLLFDVSQP
jgi:aminoglycoside phosphotransferase (APT) family kinase protein